MGVSYPIDECSRISSNQCAQERVASSSSSAVRNEPSIFTHSVLWAPTTVSARARHTSPRLFRLTRSRRHRRGVRSTAAPCTGHVQPLVATPGWRSNRSCSLNTSAGAFQPSTLRGRLFRARATASRSLVEVVSGLSDSPVVGGGLEVRAERRGSEGGHQRRDRCHQLTSGLCDPRMRPGWALRLWRPSTASFRASSLGHGRCHLAGRTFPSCAQKSPSSKRCGCGRRNLTRTILRCAASRSRTRCRECSRRSSTPPRMRKM